MTPKKWTHERNLPLRHRLAMGISLLLLLFAALPSPGCGASTAEEVAAIRIHIKDSDMPALRQLVDNFADAHDFSEKEEFTMPPHRKLFLVPGAFSTTYAGKDGYYLAIHNLVGKPCVVIQLYGDAPLPGLMTALKGEINKALPGKSTIIDSSTCGDSN